MPELAKAKPDNLVVPQDSKVQDPQVRVPSFNHRTVELWITQRPEPSETLDGRTRHFGPHLGRSKAPGRNIGWLVFYSVWWSLR